jgi:hypothetical protein
MGRECSSLTGFVDTHNILSDILKRLYIPFAKSGVDGRVKERWLIK